MAFLKVKEKWCFRCKHCVIVPKQNKHNDSLCIPLSFKEKVINDILVIDLASPLSLRGKHEFPSQQSTFKMQMVLFLLFCFGFKSNLAKE